MDLEFVLDEMDVRADPFALCELNGTCNLDHGRDPTAMLHYVLAGEGDVVLSGRAPIAVGPGTLIMIPALQPHVLRCSRGPAAPLPECRPAEIRLRHVYRSGDTTGGARMLALCANFTLGLRKLQNLVDLIREPMVETLDEASGAMVSIQGMLRELSDPRPGSRAMIRAYLLQCMIEVLRRRLTGGDTDMTWMAALRDPKLWPALQMMIDTPGRLHSLESLAASAGMSRSAFAERFANAYGSGPMELLRDLRMRHASSLLRESDLPVKRIGETVGYRSRSAFTRAFEAITGMSPQRYRTEGKHRRAERG